MQKRKRPHVRSAAQTETIHEQHSAQSEFVQPRSRPILFSGAMINAIREGRKTQTRRVVSERRIEGAQGEGAVAIEGDGGPDRKLHLLARCPYGAAGDRLWVKETFVRGYGLAAVADMSHSIAAPGSPPAPSVIYRADGAVLPANCHWRPSIFMPRVASRLLLVIEELDVERLQDVTEQGAIAEGISASTSNRATEEFAALWDGINDQRKNCSWSDNPLVYVITFHLAHDSASSHAMSFTSSVEART